jgi:DNA-binding transcriptional regulator YhcF (GntR family)
MSFSSRESAADPHYYTTTEPHTAIPDWLPFAFTLTAEARTLISATLVLQRHGTAPTRRHLAEQLQVDERSVYRWFNEINDKGYSTIVKRGRRRIMIFHKPKPDRAITDRMITDQAITDHAIRFQDSDSIAHDALARHDRAIPDQAISDPSLIGWLDDNHAKKKEIQPTKHARRQLKTELAKWLLHQGMNAANKFDDPALDYDLYRNDFERKRSDGWMIGRIVEAWLAAPLSAAEQEADDLAERAQLADEQAERAQLAGDQGAQLADDPSDDANAFSARIRRELFAKVNAHPYTYHGGAK